VVGVQLYSRVGSEDESLPGALRAHLACGLLALAGVRPGDAVLDPFMGTGTILRAAARHYRAAACLGAEVNRPAFRLAQQRVEAAGAAREDDVLEVNMLHGAFDSLDEAQVREGVRIASPALRRAVRTDRDSAAVAFPGTSRPAGRRMALLLGREQAAEVGPALGLRVKHVLVLGQPAAIASGKPMPSEPHRQR
jgi:hypothetical protein